MWAIAQRDGRPAEYRWRPVLNAAKFGWFLRHFCVLYFQRRAACSTFQTSILNSH